MRIYTKYIVDYVFLTSMVGFPFVVGLTEIFGAESTFYSILVRATVAVASLCYLLTTTLSKRLELSRLVVLFACFWLLYLGRLLQLTFTAEDTLSIPLHIYWTFSVGACFLPFIAIAINQKYQSRDIRRLYWTLTFLLVVAGIVISQSVTSAVTIYSVDGVSQYETGRAGIKSLNPISYGHVGASILLLSFWGALQVKGHLAKTLLILSMMFGGYVLLTAGSRGPIVGCAVSLSLFVYVGAKSKSVFTAVSLAAASLITWLQFYQFPFLSQYTVFDRMVSAAHLSDASSIGRVRQFEEAFREIASHPILGSTLELPILNTYPHNIIIEAFMATGVVGGLVMFVGLSSAFKTAITSLLPYDDRSWIALLFIQYTVAAMFSGAIWSSTSLWSLLALLLSATNSRRKSFTVAGRRTSSSMPATCFKY